MRRATFVALTLVTLASFPGHPLSAQSRKTVGLFVGRAQSRQLWGSALPTREVEGLAAGVYVDVETPVPFLSIRAEAGYVRRGTAAREEEEEGPGSEARVHSHYLTLPVLGMVGLQAGPVLLSGFAGPSLDTLLKTTCTPDFCFLLGEERRTVLNVALGGSVGFALGDLLWVHGEGRLTEGLTEAYLSELASVRNRSKELILRLAIPF